MKRWMALIAIGYPAGLATAIIVMMQRDPFSIFDQVYMLATLVFLPALLLTFTVIIGRSARSPGWTWVAILGLWVLLVTGLHLWFIGAVAQSV